MRIKKYQNWKLNDSNLLRKSKYNKNQKDSSFQISQLIKYDLGDADNQKTKHIQSIFTDPRTKNNFINFNLKNTSKKNIQSRVSVKTSENKNRQQQIKNKIKERIVEEFQSTPSRQNSNIQNARNGSKSQIKFSKPLPMNIVKNTQSNVYVRGNSLSLSSFKIRSQKNQSFQLTKDKYSYIFKRSNKSQNIGKRKDINNISSFKSTQIDSSSRHFNSKRGRHSLNWTASFKDIQPWQMEASHPLFQF